MKTVAIYEKTPDGMLRLGTFTPKKYYSVRSISEQFMKRHPHADASLLYFCRRGYSIGGIVDIGEKIPFDPGESESN